jgi:hypothetical protein
MKPEFYIFVDEQCKPANHLTRTIVSAIITEQDSWKNNFKTAELIGQSSASKRLQLISKLLVQANGLGVVMYADTNCYGGVTHYTDDIPEMAGNDNIWSIIVVCVIAKALRWLGDDVTKSALIDIGYDLKSLKLKHRTVFEDYIRRRVPEIAKEKRGSDFSIRGLNQIPKREGKTAPDILQQGVMIADRLCNNAKYLISGKKMPRISCENASIEDLLALFQEKPAI